MDTREHILQTAQRLVQQRGFNGFSYADIAEEVGVRKASLHHYFPTKTDLGMALVEGFSAAVGDALDGIGKSGKPADEKLRSYVALFRGALKADRMCLCGMLSSEALTLDAVMLPNLKRFFVRNTEWLTEVMVEGKSQHLFALSGTAADHARVFLSAMQGALLIARSTKDHDAFDQTASLLIASLMRKG